VRAFSWLVILGLLAAAIAATAVFVVRSGSRGTPHDRQVRKCAAQMGQAARSVQRYHKVHGRYPDASGHAFLEALLVKDVLSEPRLLRCCLAEGAAAGYWGRHNADPKQSITTALELGEPASKIAVACDPVIYAADGTAETPHAGTWHVAFLDGHVGKVDLSSPLAKQILQQLGP